MPRTTLEINAKDNASKTLDNVKKKTDDVGKSLAGIGKIGAGVVLGKGLEEAAKMVWQGMVKAAESSQQFKTAMDEVNKQGQATMQSFGMLIGAFGTDLVKAIGDVMKAFNSWMQSSEGIKTIAGAAAKVQAGFNAVKTAVEPLGQIFTPLVETLKQFIGQFVNAGGVILKLFKGDIKGAIEQAGKVVESTKGYVKSLGDTYIATGKAIYQTVTQDFGKIKTQYEKDEAEYTAANTRKLESAIQTSEDIYAVWKKNSDAFAKNQEYQDQQVMDAWTKAQQNKQKEMSAGLQTGGKMLYDSLTNTLNLYYQTQLQNENLSAEERKRLQTEQFNVSKATSMTQAIINTAEGVTKALATLPPPLSYIAAGVVGAMGAVQVGLIAGQQAPAFATGGVTPGGMALVGERGPELVQLPAGSRVYNNSETSNYMNRATTINVTGPIVARDPIEFYRKLSIQSARAEGGR